MSHTVNTLLALETPRLTLRKMQASDSQFIIELMNDPDWLKFIGDRNIRTKKDAVNHIQNVVEKSYAEFAFGMLIVSEKSTNKAVGLAGLLQRDYLPYPDIGYAFLPSGRGNGYAQEASLALLNCASSVLPSTPIYATVDAKNTPSIRLLDKLGFDFEKVMEGIPSEEIHLYIKYSNVAAN